MITAAMVDAVLLDEDQDDSSALGDLLDKHGAWDWTDGSDHAPSDRLAVLESSGAWWCVYRGTESDDAWRFATRAEARAKFAALIELTDETPAEATDEQIEQLRLQAVNDTTREIAHTGILLTHDQADDLGDEVLNWIGSRLGLRVTETDEGTMCEVRS